MRQSHRAVGPLSRRPASLRPGNASISPAVAYALRRAQKKDVSTDPLARDESLAKLEACLMLSDEPIPLRRLTDACGFSNATETEQQIQRLKALYESDGTAFQISEIAGGFQLQTRVSLHPWLLRLRRTGHDARLTAAAMETLAIVAYKQPITRAEVEKIRGVQCGDLFRLLMEKGLIRVAGRHESLGRPQLYGTTPHFLVLFGLNTLEELPEIQDFKNPG